MDIVLPHDVRDLKIQIGTDIYESSTRLADAPDRIKILKAEVWRDEHKALFEQLGFAADQALVVFLEADDPEALDARDEALLSFARHIRVNDREIERFLDRQPSKYVWRLVGALPNLDYWKMKNVLQSFSMYGRGE